MKTTGEQLNTEALAKALAASPLRNVEVARQVGVARSTLSNWLAGHRNPTLGNLLKLAVVLGVQVDDLVKRSATAADTQ